MYLEITGTVVLSLANNLLLNWQFNREKKTGKSWRLGSVLGSIMLMLIIAWAIFVFWYGGFITGVVCVIVYLPVSYLLEKYLGLLNFKDPYKPWKK